MKNQSRKSVKPLFSQIILNVKFPKLHNCKMNLAEMFIQLDQQI